MTRRIGPALVAIGLVAAAAGRADAGPVATFQFTGTDNATGDPFSGSFSYDLATPAATSFTDPTGTVTSYEPSESFPANFSITSGGVTYSSAATAGALILVFDDFRPFNAREPRDELVISIPGLGPDSLLDIRLLDFDRDAFSSSALPATLDLAQFEVVIVTGSGEGGRPNFFGTLTSLEMAPAAVPEPATFATAGLGALMGLGYAWRRRRAAA